MKPRSLEPLEIIGWYDGIVQAVVSPSWMKGQYLCSLLAFDVSSRKRVFALLPLTESELLDFKSETTVDASTLKDDAICDIEEAVSEERVKWFDTFRSNDLLR